MLYALPTRGAIESVATVLHILRRLCASGCACVQRTLFDLYTVAVVVYSHWIATVYRLQK